MCNLLTLSSLILKLTWINLIDVAYSIQPVFLYYLMIIRKKETIEKNIKDWADGKLRLKLLDLRSIKRSYFIVESIDNSGLKAI